MTRTEALATFNVGTVRGGTRPNVVPAEATIEIDMRAEDMATAERLAAAMLARRPFDPDVRIEVEGGINRPPFERSPAVARMYGALTGLAAELGQPMAETRRGDVSDGNFAAALGRPVIDGLAATARARMRSTSTSSSRRSLHDRLSFTGCSCRPSFRRASLPADEATT